ncbi:MULTISPECIES: hypothetical protein [unclassified Anabaena]|uniref:hypothetical protein n=1 Tax=unclassified Anabaena TaxID=2619674 RepID=UPI0039C760EF
MVNKLNKNQSTSWTNKLWKSKGAAVLILGTLLVSACENVVPEATAPEEPGNVTTEQVSDRTEELIGQTVTVRSEPENMVSPTTFTIGDDKLFGSDNVLVVNATGEPLTIPEGQNIEIQATGTVRRFNLAEINQEYKLNLQPNVYSEYENQPTIIAQSLALAPKPGDITSDPTFYYGKTLAVAGEVADVKNQASFALDDDQLLGGENLLVLHTQAQPQASVNDGEDVVVTGVLRPFVVAELERDYDLTWDLNLQRQLEAEYSNKPVLVATGVYPSAVDQ